MICPKPRLRALCRHRGRRAAEYGQLRSRGSSCCLPAGDCGRSTKWPCTARIRRPR